MAQREVTVGVGAGAADAVGTDVVVDLGPHHPSAHGLLRVRLVLEEDRIVRAEPLVGYLHRGAEKLFEVRDYRQLLVLANRHDWLSAFSSELGVALAVERLLGLEVPVRATWARTLLAELNRVLNHLMFLGTVPVELGGHGRGSVALEERETVQAVMEEATGGRIHFMFNRVGGLRDDLPAGWLGRVLAATASVRARLGQIEDEVLGDPTFERRTRGVGHLRPALVEAYGVSGPVARASGVDLDLRRDEPYLAYADLAAEGVLQVPVAQDGDCHARFRILLEQVRVSLDLADACVDHLSTLPVGPVNVRLPKILRPPEGATYAWTENPLGLNGYYLVSRGERTPWRMKLRTASFNNVAVLRELLVGCGVADLVAVLGSLFFVVGDLDK